MKVIVIGNGGREHAIAWKLAQSSSVTDVICVPGNGGTALEEKCTNIDPSSYSGELSGNDVFVKIAQDNSCTLAVVGPENPPAEGQMHSGKPEFLQSVQNTRPHSSKPAKTLQKTLCRNTV